MELFAFKTKKTLNYKEAFNKYYERFLGNEQRNVPLNMKYQDILISKIFNKNIFRYSISPYIDLNDYRKNLLWNTKSYCDLLNTLNENFSYTYKIEQVLRMSVDKKYSETELPENIKANLRIYEQKYLKYLKFIKIYNKYSLINKSILLGYCNITNIDYNGANIDLYTTKGFDAFGISTYLLHKMLEYCTNMSLIPIYVINRNSTIQIRIAQNLGMKTIANEIILSKK
jgi:hypothetical protein